MAGKASAGSPMGGGSGWAVVEELAGGAEGAAVAAGGGGGWAVVEELAGGAEGAAAVAGGRWWLGGGAGAGQRG